MRRSSKNGTRKLMVYNGMQVTMEFKLKGQRQAIHGVKDNEKFVPSMG